MKYLLYGALASLGFIIFLAAITELLGVSDYTYIAICMVFGTVVTCTLYILESVHNLRRDLNQNKDINN
ncbi:MAG: hypothetical protein PHT78_11615 [Desulfitobacteriaceae bacterium]|jgi:MFS superfamily sulfate permease-like transporter|nr:hypothetical protein [Desulfitobacteriaceae bacterium]